MSKTAERLIAEATPLFAAHGYAGTSVRAVCAAAEANLNAVSYHFGGKRGLYNAVIRTIGDKRLAASKRILAAPATSPADLRTRLELFASETLAAWLEAPELLVILFAELRQGFPNCDADALASVIDQRVVLIGFLRSGVESGLVRADVDLDILTGAILERLNNQVMFADAVHAHDGTSIKDDAYRAHWVTQTVTLFLDGARELPRT